MSREGISLVRPPVAAEKLQGFFAIVPGAEVVGLKRRYMVLAVGGGIVRRNAQGHLATDEGLRERAPLAARERHWP